MGRDQADDKSKHETGTRTPAPDSRVATPPAQCPSSGPENAKARQLTKRPFGIRLHRILVRYGCLVGAIVFLGALWIHLASRKPPVGAGDKVNSETFKNIWTEKDAAESKAASHAVPRAESRAESASSGPTAVQFTEEAVPRSELLRLRLEHYKERLEDFSHNLQVQVVFLVIGGLLLLRYADPIDLHYIALPLRWLHIVVPVGLVYLWLKYGFILDDLIETRLRALVLISGTPHEGFGGKSLFWDSGLIDGWFLLFVDPYSPGLKPDDPGLSGILPNSSTLASIIIIIAMGAQIALSHAMAMAISQVGIRRYFHPSHRRRRIWALILPNLPVCVFVMTHVMFAYGGDNRNWLQFVVIGLTLVFCWMAIGFSLKVDRRGEWRRKQRAGPKPAH